MSLVVDDVRVVIDGRDFTKWAGYTLRSSVFQVPSTFDLTLGKVDADTLDVVSTGAPVEIYVDVQGVDQLRLTGRIEQRTHEYDAGMHRVAVSGMDRAQDLMVATAPFDLAVAGRRFVDIVRDLLAPWDYDCVVSNELDRYVAANKPRWKQLLKQHAEEQYYLGVLSLQEAIGSKVSFKAECKKLGIPGPPHIHNAIIKKSADAKVSPGESVWKFITRVANKGEAITWMSPTGKLIISRPQYEQEPLYVLSRRPSQQRENNVKAASETLSFSNVPTSMSVFGSIREKGKKRVPYAAQEMGTAAASARDAYGLLRPVFKKARDARDGDEIRQQAYYSMKAREVDARTYQYTVAGHSQDGVVWTPDTVVRIDDDVLNIHGLYYIATTTMSRARALNSPSPQETILEITPLDVWVPEGD